MTDCKKKILHLIACECFIILSLDIFVLSQEVSGISQFGLVSPLATVNCSAYCRCQLVDINHGIQQHYHKHNAFSSTKFGSDFKSASKHSEFLGIFSLVVGNMISITCDVNDGRTHTISSLLNGIEYLKYSALRISCRSGELLVWDIPSRQVSFNIFESKKCNIVPGDESNILIIPMNMWIFEAIGVGKDLMDQIDTRWATNTLSLSIEGTDTFNIPDRWGGDAMISLDRFNLQSNNLKRFDCKIQFTKDMDLISLNDNDLTKFPECLLRENRIKIRLLSLSNNEISDISCLFGKSNLQGVVESIDLSFNSLQKIGTFMPIKDLTILDLSNNQITQINDDAFNQLHGLRQLHLQNNRINFIGPVAFRENVQLRMLKLSNNFLKFVQGEQFSAKTNLQIDLRRNKLRLPPFMSEIKRNTYPSHIKVLASKNLYMCDCSMLKFQQYLEANQTNNGSKHFLDLDQYKCNAPRINKGKTLNNISFTQSCAYLDDCPLNCECTLLATTHFVINCTARRLLEMPETIPIYPFAKMILDLSHNPLQLLGRRSYLSKLSELYMDNCLMTSVSPQAILALQNVQVLRLHNNLLQKLPSNTKNITLKKASNVTLHNNRWSCSCDSLWLPNWISMHRSIVWMPGSVLCSYLQKPVEDFSPSDVNCESFSNKDVILALSMTMSSVLSTFLLFFYYTKEIKLFLYTKLGLRLCTDFSYGDVFSPYDAFVSYGQDNYRWVVDTLVPTLEGGDTKYKLCLHYRDFPTDESNIENIPWAIRLSRCSILILSKDFIKKEWSIMELRAVFQRLLMSANKLIIIATDDVAADDLTPDLRDYMKTHEILRINESRFWEKLEMFLPPKENVTDVLPVIQEEYSDEVEDTNDRKVTEETTDNQLDYGEGDGGSGKNEGFGEGGDCGSPK